MGIGDWAQSPIPNYIILFLNNLIILKKYIIKNYLINNNLLFFFIFIH